MACIYIKDGREVTEDQLKEEFLRDKARQQRRDSFTNEDATFFSPSEPAQPNFIVALKQYEKLLARARYQMQQNKIALNQNRVDPVKSKELSAVATDLKDRVEQLERSVGIMSKKEGRNMRIFSFHAETELARLDNLVKGEPTVEQIAEARDIIKFYEDLGRMNKSNPLINPADMLDGEGNVILDGEIQDQLLGFARRASRAETKLEGLELDRAMNFINGLSKVDRMTKGKGYTKEEVFHSEGGLKDATWMDMFLMDVTNGIFSHNGIAPQAMMVMLQNSIQDEMIFYKNVVRELESIQDDVEDLLRKEFDAGFKVLGFKGVSYDILRAKDSDGFFMDSIVQRFASGYFTNKGISNRTFYKELGTANEAKTEHLRRLLTEKANVKRNDWIKRNTEVIDVAMLPEIIAEAAQFTSGERLGSLDDATAYKAKLVEILGSEQGYSEALNKVKAHLQAYKNAKSMVIDSLLTEGKVESPADLDPKLKRKLAYWESRESPFAAAKLFRNKSLRILNSTKNTVTTTPSIKFSPSTVERIKVRVNTSQGNINIETRILENPKEGDEAVFESGDGKHAIILQTSDNSYASKTSLSIRFESGEWVPFQDSALQYTESIPLRNYRDTTGSLKTGRTFTDTNEETGYYDGQFKAIEAHPKLLQFHGILNRVRQKMEDHMPPEIRARFGQNSLVAHQKAISEILADPHMGLREKLSEGFGTLYDRIRGSFGIKPQSIVSRAMLDPETGKPEYQVSTEFMNSNRPRILQLLDIELGRMEVANDGTKIDKDKQYKLGELNDEVVQILAENLQVYANTRDSMGRAKTLAEIKEALPSKDMESLNVYRAMRASITHQVVQENTMDMPKLIKLYSYLTSEYAGRTRILPALKLIKKHYDAIKDPKQTNLGSEMEDDEENRIMVGEREAAKKQMESWFKRSVLGDYSSKAEFNDTRIKNKTIFGVTGQEAVDRVAAKLSLPITGRILSREEKQRQAKLDHLIGHVQNEKDLKKYQEQRAQLGRQFSGTALFDNIFNFIRLLGLGWNVSSYVTNFMEGQVANMIVAASEDYFDSDLIYRANDIVKGSIIKNFTSTYAPAGAIKASIFMQRYQVLQDASNELQKASTKSAYSNLGLLDPYEGTRRTEYLNQAPLMIAMLLHTKIKGKSTLARQEELTQSQIDALKKGYSTDGKTTTAYRVSSGPNTGRVFILDSKGELTDYNGMTLEKLEVPSKVANYRFSQVIREENNALSGLAELNLTKEELAGDYSQTEGLTVPESSVWDAMNDDGTLKEEFATEENINSWENTDGEQYKDFSSKLTKLIVNAHGDYDELRGNLASEYISGKALLMFKRWMSRQFYQRFARVGYDTDRYGNKVKRYQVDLEAEIEDFGGRYWSHTQASGMLHGAILGFGALSMFSAGPLGLLVGGGIGLVGSKLYGANSGLSFLEDAANVGKNLVLTGAGIITNNITGKPTLSVDKAKSISDRHTISERDAKNLKANLVEMSTTLAWIGLLLFSKAMFWDDDDEEDSTRRKAHNFLANRFLQMSSQAAMYLNPVAAYENTLGSMALIRYFEGVVKLGKEAADLVEGRDIQGSGPNAGQSAFYNQLLKTTMPVVGRDIINLATRGEVPTLGLGAQMERQFMPHHFDPWFKSSFEKERSANRAKRSTLKTELESQGMEDKAIRKLLDQRFPYAKKPE